MGNTQIKDKFCIKHPGYEKLFFSSKDMKGLCEKCLQHHKSEDVFTVALKARDMRRDFEEFRAGFTTNSKGWITYYDDLKKKRNKMDKEIDKTTMKIESVFRNLHEMLERRKLELVDTFR